jgi:hypothetical protein
MHVDIKISEPCLRSQSPKVTDCVKLDISNINTNGLIECEISGIYTSKSERLMYFTSLKGNICKNVNCLLIFTHVKYLRVKMSSQISTTEWHRLQSW